MAPYQHGDTVLQPSIQMPAPMAVQGDSEGGLFHPSHDRVVVDPEWLEWYMQPSGSTEETMSFRDQDQLGRAAEAESTEEDATDATQPQTIPMASDAMW